MTLRELIGAAAVIWMVFEMVKVFLKFRYGGE